MRHKKNFNHLGRKTGHRKAMLSNMATSLIMHKRIETTTAKAKALKKYVEPLITKSKDDSTHARRVVFSYLQDKDAVTELFREVSVKVADRPGGYTRIIRLGNRLGDNADMCLIELVDYNEILLTEKAASKKPTSRRRRGGGKTKTATGTATESPEAEVEEAVVEETAVEDTVVEETAVEETSTEEEPKTETPVEEPKAEVVEEPQPEAKNPEVNNVDETEEDTSTEEEKKDL